MIGIFSTYRSPQIQSIKRMRHQMLSVGYLSSVGFIKTLLIHAALDKISSAGPQSLRLCVNRVRSSVTINGNSAAGLQYHHDGARSVCLSDCRLQDYLQG